MDSRFLDSQSAIVRAGNRVPNVPRNAFALWTGFDPVEQLGAAVGVIRQGRRFAATDNSVSLAGYTRIDGALYYRVTDQFDVQLNVENILNKRYFLYSDNNTNLTPGSPTAFRVGVNARF